MSAASGRWDCYAHVGAHRGVYARDLLAEMDCCEIAHAMLVPFLDAPAFDDLLAAAHEWPDRFGALCRFDVAAQGVTVEGAAALLARGFLGVRVALPGAAAWTDEQTRAMAALLQALDGQGGVLLVHAPGGIGAHAGQLAAWARRYPRLRIFVPHLGWPRTAQGEDTPDWEDGLHALAECERIFMGLSALYFFSRQAPPFEDTFALVRTALQTFGPDRCVLAGDCPMTLDNCTYAQVWDALARAVDDPIALETMWTESPASLW